MTVETVSGPVALEDLRRTLMHEHVFSRACARRASYGDRIHLSHDAACFMDFMTGDPFFANERPDDLLISTAFSPRCCRPA